MITFKRLKAVALILTLSFLLCSCYTPGLAFVADNTEYFGTLGRVKESSETELTIFKDGEDMTFLMNEQTEYIGNFSGVGDNVDVVYYQSDEGETVAKVVRVTFEKPVDLQVLPDATVLDYSASSLTVYTTTSQTITFSLFDTTTYINAPNGIGIGDKIHVYYTGEPLQQPAVASIALSEKAVEQSDTTKTISGSLVSIDGNVAIINIDSRHSYGFELAPNAVSGDYSFTPGINLSITYTGSLYSRPVATSIPLPPLLGGDMPEYTEQTIYGMYVGIESQASETEALFSLENAYTFDFNFDTTEGVTYSVGSYGEIKFFGIIDDDATVSAASVYPAPLTPTYIFDPEPHQAAEGELYADIVSDFPAASSGFAPSTELMPNYITNSSSGVLSQFNVTGTIEEVSGDDPRVATVSIGDKTLEYQVGSFVTIQNKELSEQLVATFTQDIAGNVLSVVVY